MDTPSKTAQPLAILCDFDESFAEQNVAETVLEHCGDGSWRPIRERFRQSEITLRQYQEAVFRSLGRTREEMARIVRERCNARPYAREVLAACQRRGFPIEIVTNGLDFYVEALLEREGLTGLPYVAVKASFGPSLTYLYTVPPADCGHAPSWGICKCAAIERYRRSGHFAVYVCDGTSDICPASRADFVFARNRLLEYCMERGLRHQAFNDFSPVLEMVEGWPMSTNTPEA